MSPFAQRAAPRGETGQRSAPGCPGLTDGGTFPYDSLRVTAGSAQVARTCVPSSGDTHRGGGGFPQPSDEPAARASRYGQAWPQDGECVAGAGWRELFAGGLARTTCGLLLMEGLVAVQVLVTVAVLPAVVSDLGGVRLFGAALSASQVATVIVLPFTPRLVTRWGLRGAFYASLGTFVVGSLVVISARLVAVRRRDWWSRAPAPARSTRCCWRSSPAATRYACVRGCTPRWRWRGRFPGLLGPAYGGFVASTLGWRWAFALILPLVVPAVWMLHPSLTEPERTRRDPSEVQPGEHVRAGRLRGEHARPPGRAHGLGAGGRTARPAVRGRRRGRADAHPAARHVPGAAEGCRP